MKIFALIQIAVSVVLARLFPKTSAPVLARLLADSPTLTPEKVELLKRLYGVK